MPRSLTTIRRQHRERGSVLIITAAMLMVLLGILALSLDIGYVLSGRTQLQTGIDSAACAAAAGLHTAIETGAGYSHQDNEIIKPLAVKYAGLNAVRRYPSVQTQDTVTYPQGLKPDPNDSISLDASDIEIQHGAQPPRVVIKHRLDQDPHVAPPAPGGNQDNYNSQRRKGKIPTIFASIFGMDAIGVGAGAVAALLPVEGGTGLVSGGWRPIMLPDTFFDSANQVWAYGEAGHPVPDAALGDYYRSRFAGGARNVFPFIDGSVRDAVTSIRDANSNSELRPNGGKNLLAQQITIKRGDWRLVNFDTTYPGMVPSDGGFPGFQLRKQISTGYYAYVRVGDTANVYPKIDPIYDSMNTTLRNLSLNNLTPDIFDDNKLTTYGYVKSALYPTANTHLQVIPVLLCNPIDLAKNPDKTQYQVTNIGAFFLKAVNVNGDLTGYFVREVLIGGVPLQAQNDVADRSLLPGAVRLLK